VPSPRKIQYFEMGGTRAIYDNGWVAATSHGIVPWSDDRKDVAFQDDKWELYDLSKDFTEHDDVAAQNPGKLTELKAAFLDEAKKHNVLPLDDRGGERFSAQLAGRPLGPAEGIKTFTYYPGMIRLPEGSAPDIKNKSFKLTAEVVIPDKGADGILITQGGLFAGWALLINGSKPSFVYNWLQEQITPISARDGLPPGKHTIAFEFTYDGGGAGKGGKGVLSVDGKSVAEARIEKTVPNRFSLDETLDVGEDTGTPVTQDYKVPYRFTGDLKKVVIELK
jgi:arylsulfatase